jgi:hypothetical protein
VALFGRIPDQTTTIGREKQIERFSVIPAETDVNERLKKYS